jgi:hypothetical protein
MSPSRQVARFDGRSPSANRGDSRNIHIFGPEVIQKLTAGIIVAYHPHSQNAGAQIRQVVCGIGAASRNKLRFAVAQDQYRRFTRDSGDLAKNKPIGHEVSENRNRLPREALDKLLKPCEIGAHYSSPVDFRAFLNTSKSITSATE